MAATKRAKKITGGVADAAPSAVPPAPALPEMAGVQTDGPPAEAFAGLPKGQMLRRVGGRLVPVGGPALGTVSNPAQALRPQAPPPVRQVHPAQRVPAHPSMLPHLPANPARPRTHNPLFTAPGMEESAIRSQAAALKQSFRSVFSQLDHALVQAEGIYSFLSGSMPAAAPILQAEDIDLQEVQAFMTAAHALLDQFAPPLPPQG